MKKNNRPLTRREFLKVLGGSIGAGALLGTGFWRSWFEKIKIESLTKPLLGTWITITVHHPDAIQAKEGIEKAFAAISTVDRVMSIHKQGSDLSQVNHHAGSELVTVDPSVLDAFQTATHVFESSGGVYDVTCLPLMQLYGFYTDQKQNPSYPSDASILDAAALTNQRWVTIDPKSNQMGLLRAGMGIDFGSIGKGYAVDRAGDVLRQAGIENALIDCGGNILALGAPYGNPDLKEGWRVAIRNPMGGVKNPYFETLLLRDKAVATSGNYEQGLCFDKQRVGHLMDAITGKPSDPGISATVIAENATLADAFSTAAFLLGPSNLPRLKKNKGDVYFHGYGEIHFYPGC